jgi:uncharacterized protein YktA (UPF0223 family)
MKGIEANQEDGVDVVRLSEAYRRRIHIVLSRKEDTGVIGRGVYEPFGFGVLRVVETDKHSAESLMVLGSCR